MDRGVKQAGLIVLHQTIMPSVLVEVGFLTYKPEGIYLNSNRGQSDMASSITDAILDYKKGLDQNIGEDIYTETTEITESSSNSPVTITDESYIFKVQIAASSKKLEPKPYNFKGLEGVSREQEGSLYRYFYGNTSNYDQAKQLEDTAKKKYKSCFIVVYKDGKRIELSEALKSISN